MRFAVLLAMLGASSLAGCVVNAPVEGTVQGTGEKFTGVATGSTESGGTLEIVSNRTTCKGAFTFTDGRRGRGTFLCADGRTGPFEFVSSSARTGTGRFLSQPFIFTFS